jgi:F-type H+-transporting ATPase subunit b
MIDIDWTLYAQIINFLLLVFLLNLVLFRPIRKALRDRQARLAEQEALKQEGSQAEAALLEAVKKEVDLEWGTVEKKIKADMTKARQALKTQAQSFAQLLAAKVLGRELS